MPQGEGKTGIEKAATGPSFGEDRTSGYELGKTRDSPTTEE